MNPVEIKLTTWFVLRLAWLVGVGFGLGLSAALGIAQTIRIVAEWALA